MNQQSAPEARVLSDEAFAVAREQWYVRHGSTRATDSKGFYEGVVSGDLYVYQMCSVPLYEEVTIAKMRDWLHDLEILATEFGCEPLISAGSTSDIEAQFFKKSPFEPEEVEYAKYRLETWPSE